MALAILTPDPADPSGRGYELQLGSNRYWRIALGPETRRTSQGVELLADPTWISPLNGPLPETAMGRARFEIPHGIVDREVRFMQLMSYQDADRNGPAVSPIRPVQVAPNGHDHLPPAAFSLVNTPHTSHAMGPMRWREVPHYSMQQDFGITAGIGGLAAVLGPLIAKAAPTVLAALPSIAGIVGGVSPVIGQLLGSVLPNQQGQTARDAGQALGGLSNQQLRNDIAALTEVIRNTQTPAAAAAPTTPTAPAGAAPAPVGAALPGQASLMNLSSKSRAARARGHWAPRRSQARSVSVAMDGGIISGAIAAQTLVPILQQVLTPETVQQVLQMPNQHMQTIFNGLKDAAKLALQSHEQDLKHLRELNPGVDDPALDAMLNAMSIGLAQPDPGRDWVRAASVGLRLLDIKTQPLAGRQISLYARGHALGFPLAVELPVAPDGRSPSINDAIVQIQVKHAETLSVLLTKEVPVGDIKMSGRLPIVPSIAAHEADAFPDDHDVIFCFTLIWENAKGEPRGAPQQHRGRMAPTLSFDRLEPGGETFALSDRARFGDYWHKIWAGRFGDKSKSFDVEAWYAYALAPESADTHQRLETVEATQPVESSIARMKARLRTGMELSPAALMRLGAMLDPSIEALSVQAVAALQAPAFSEALNRSARAVFSFRGTPDDAFEVFAYPVIGLDTGVFRTADAVDLHGQVTGTKEVRLKIPVPREMAFRAASLRGGANWIGEADVPLNRANLVVAQTRQRQRHG